MMVNMGLYMAIVTCVLLALVAGLLMTVGVWLYEFRKNYNKMPALAEQLAKQLMAARDAMDNLKKAARESVPELERKLLDTSRTMQDLRFLTSRAEEVLNKLEQGTPVVASVTETVSVATSHADDATIVVEQTLKPLGGPMLGAGGVMAARVAVSNGQAASVLNETPDTQPDPLEELLAGLSSANETALEEAGLVAHEVSATAKATRIKSQAELDLRAKLAS